MLRIIVLVVLLLVVYRIIKAKSYKNARKRFAALTNESAEVKIFTDPVCGAKVAHKNAHLLVYNGEEYGFCGKKCMRAFQQGQNGPWKM